MIDLIVFGEQHNQLMHQIDAMFQALIESQFYYEAVRQDQIEATKHQQFMLMQTNNINLQEAEIQALRQYLVSSNPEIAPYLDAFDAACKTAEQQGYQSVFGG